MKEICLKIYGEDAKKICRELGLVFDGDTAETSTKVKFTYKPCEGRSKVLADLFVVLKPRVNVDDG